MIRIKPVIIISFLITACSNNSKTDTPVIDSIGVGDTTAPIVSIQEPVGEKRVITTFERIRKFPVIDDTAAFINDLMKATQLEVHQNPIQQRNQKISYYKKIKLYGSDQAYVLLEYDYAEGAMASYPWKYQLLFTEDGKLIHEFSALHFRFLDVFPGKAPLLLTTVSTGKGNGGHELYRVRADTLENVYEGYYDYHFSTYDAHEDMTVYEPNELNVSLADDNRDGHKDLVFQGKLVLIEGITERGDWYSSIRINDGKTTTYSIDNPFRKIPVRLVYLYDPGSGHFKEKEDYEKKYERIELLVFK